MLFIKERSNFSNTTRGFRVQSISNKVEAACWLYNVKNLPELAVKHISMCDLKHGSDEGNTGIDFEPDVSLDKMVYELLNREIDYIFINAEFEEKPVVIGVNLHDYTAYITLRNKKMADIIMLENLLKLLED